MKSKALFFVALLGLAAGAQQTQEEKDRQAENEKIAAQLPDGEGRSIMVARCGACHSLARITAGKKSLKSWTNTVKVMVMNGAVLESKEEAPLAQYLATNFAPAVNVNSAPAAELATVPGVEDSLAAAIVAYREKHGDFATLDDLTKVDGFTPDLLKQVSARLTVGVKAAVPK
jgi:competence protein ComEA